jgi:glutamate N-acetyltransferase/amino-acid N-acetyltransferase
MSTNDSVVILANGRAENKILTGSSGNVSLFAGALTSIMKELAIAIVRDGEGATKVIRISVEGAKSNKEAKTAAFAVARSNLVKTAFFGKDPNWGRVISAIGASGIALKTDAVELLFNGIPLFSRGSVLKRDEKTLAKIMEQDLIDVLIKLSMGRGSFTAHASDLSYDYVRINADYHT